MKVTALKLLPYLLGLLLAWVLANPPAGLGPWRHPAAALLVVLALVAFTAVQILMNLPEDVSVEPDPGAAEVPELTRLAAEAEALGFERVGGFRVGVAPPARMVVGVHRGERSYLAAYRTDTIPSKTVVDFVSIFEGERGGLTTTSAAEGVALPAAPGSLRQAIPGASLTACWQRHREALAWLSGRGLRARAAMASSFLGDFKASFRRQRAAFLARPLRTTAVAFFRIAMRTSPEVGPLMSRRGIEDAVERVRSRLPD
jgi:hypothetical protein